MEFYYKISSTNHISLTINFPPAIITPVLWFISNDTLHNDLKIEKNPVTAKQILKKFQNNVNDHSDLQVSILVNKSLPSNSPHRTKRH